jgi:hypothetical protein
MKLFRGSNLLLKNCVAYPQEDFYLKYIIGLLDGSKLIKTKIIKNKYVKYLKRGYPTEFADSTHNQNKKVGILKSKLLQKKVCL